MQDDENPRHEAGDALIFSPENAFLADLAGFAALRDAFRLRVIERLSTSPQSVEQLARDLELSERGMTLLADLLTRAGVTEAGKDGDALALAPAFREVLENRGGVLEAKIAFLDHAVADVGADLAGLLFDLEGFQARSRTFGLFRYDLALDIAPAALEATAKWVRYVTALSQDEAPHLVPEIDLGGSQRLLEIGGNTGVMAEALVAANEGLTAAILDLPAVCALGQVRMAGRAVADRLSFVPGDARSIRWPGPADTVLFKSVLHDWPEADVRHLLTLAAARIAPEGRVIICERLPLATTSGPLPLWMLANLVFAPFYRTTADYERIAADCGLFLTTRRTVNLDMPFQVLSFCKATAG